MDAVKRKIIGMTTGAGCGLGGMLATLPCAGTGCAACFGCAGVGVGLAVLLAARKLFYSISSQKITEEGTSHAAQQEKILPSHRPVGAGRP